MEKKTFIRGIVLLIIGTLIENLGISLVKKELDKRRHQDVKNNQEEDS